MTHSISKYVGQEFSQTASVFVTVVHEVALSEQRSETGLQGSLEVWAASGKKRNKFPRITLLTQSPPTQCPIVAQQRVCRNIRTRTHSQKLPRPVN